ncbi:MAG: hypothetical protein M3Z18_06730 [Gemmatimonadota bacterium]|nr:hypothetical protein [Gemmatimonadota bacterium]
MKSLTIFALISVLGGISGKSATGQALGPQRQFGALEPLYAYTSLDVGPGNNRVSLKGYGGRLWLNLAPFSGPSNNLIGKTTLGLFALTTPSQGNSGVTLHQYGADADIHFADRPLIGFFDPYILVGGSAIRLNVAGARTGLATGGSTRLALAPGGGLRAQILNRFQLRGEAKDLIIFSNRTVNAGKSRTTNNLQVIASLGYTF